MLLRSKLVVTTAVFLLATGSAWTDEVRVFLVAGQSNAVGCNSDAGKLPPELYTPQPDVLFWFEEGPWGSVHDPVRRIRSDAWLPLQFQSDPDYGTFGWYDDGFGPEIKLGRTLADHLTADVAILKFAINATSLAGDWDPDTAGSLYDQMLELLDEALTVLAGQGHTPVLAGAFWMQGEWDALYSSYATAYQSNLTAFITELRAACGNPTLPFVIGRLCAGIDECPYFTFPYLHTVRAAQQAVAASVPHAAMVDTDDLPLNTDFLHFTADGQLKLGARFAQAYLDTQFQLGDLNCDGSVNVFDIDPFVLALTDGPGYASAFPDCEAMYADINGDGAVNVFDIDPFVLLLTGGRANVIGR